MNIMHRTFTVSLAIASVMFATVARADEWDDWGDDGGDDPGDDPGMDEPMPGDPAYCDWYGHEWRVEETFPPTCEDEGYNWCVCNNCGIDEDRDFVPALGHRYVNGVCTRCGKSKETLTYTYVPAVAPTCTTSGNIAYRVGSDGRCYDWNDDGLVLSNVNLPPLGHDWGEWSVTTPATCTTAGVKTHTCSRCNVSATQAIAALGHDWSDWVETTPATCTEAGEKMHTCSRCTASETQAISALGHNWVKGTVVAPTCTEQGYTPYECSRCGETENRSIKSALGHLWSAWTVTTPATSTSTGEEERSCTRSGCTAHETREIPILEHSEFTVSVSSNKFTISRSDATTVETVLYRTISLSAFAGQHYTSVTGTLTFAVGQTNKTVTVSELTPSTVAYKYQTGASRSYRFEVDDRAGAYLAHKNGSISSGITQISSNYISTNITDLVKFSGTSLTSGMSSSKYYDVSYSPSSNSSHVMNGGYIEIDDGYDYNDKTLCTIPTSTFFNQTKATQSYFKNNLGCKLYATVYFTMKEVDDGYQYIQILADNSTSKDGKDPDGGVNTPSTSLYKACFELSKASGSYPKIVKTDHYQAFPHKTDSHTSTTEFDYADAYLYAQAFQSTSYRATNSGSLVLEPTVNNINVRFDANGDNNDTWHIKNLKVRFALCDTTGPSLVRVISNNAIVPAIAVDPGPHYKGGTFYISVPFNEIVTYTGSAPTLTTSWGTATCSAGTGSNVITFKGTITAEDGTELRITGRSGTITDLVGNTFSGDLNRTFNGTVVETVPLSGSGTAADPYVITTKGQLDQLATRVNTGVTNYANTCFALGADIAYSHTTSWNVNSTENNYTGIGCHVHSFRGNFDGRGHTVSGIRIYRSGNTDADGSQGLFGFVSVGTVKNVILTDARITGRANCGAIVGYNSGTLATNYYRDVSVNNATTNIGTGTSGDLPGARSLHTLALASDISVVSAETVKITNATYYAAGSTITLAYGGTPPFGYTFSGYRINDTAFSGNAITMPAVDSSIVVNYSPVPFPAYLAGADDVVTNNWLVWAGKYGGVASAESEAAFLLDISPATVVPEGAALLKIAETGTTNIPTAMSDLGLIAMAMGYTGEYLPCRRIVLASDVAELKRREDFDTPFEVCNGYLVLRIGTDLSVPKSEWLETGWFARVEDGRAELLCPEFLLEKYRERVARETGKPCPGLFLSVSLSPRQSSSTAFSEILQEEIGDYLP